MTKEDCSKLTDLIKRIALESYKEGRMGIAGADTDLSPSLKLVHEAVLMCNNLIEVASLRR